MWDLNLKSLSRKMWDEHLKSWSRKIWDEHLKSWNRKFWREDPKSLNPKLWDEHLKSLSEKNEIWQEGENWVLTQKSHLIKFDQPWWPDASWSNLSVANLFWGEKCSAHIFQRVPLQEGSKSWVGNVEMKTSTKKYCIENGMISELAMKKNFSNRKMIETSMIVPSRVWDWHRKFSLLKDVSSSFHAFQSRIWYLHLQVFNSRIWD